MSGIIEDTIRNTNKKIVISEGFLENESELE